MSLKKNNVKNAANLVANSNSGSSTCLQVDIFYEKLHYVNDY